MTETYRPSPVQDDWELVELIERREDLAKLLAVSQKAARLNPKLKKDFQAVIEKFRLHEILKVEGGPGKVRLTLANLWRLSRCENRPGLFPEAYDPAAVTLQAFDLGEGVWKEEDPDEIRWIECLNPWCGKIHWEIGYFGGPYIWPELGIEDTPGRIVTNPYFNLLSGLAIKIFRVLGIQSYDDAGNDHDWAASLLGRFTKLRRSATISRAHVFAQSLFNRFTKLPYKQPSRLISAALRQYILDDEVLSLVRLTRQDIDFSDYLEVRAQRKHLARLTRETPNFLPVLKLIPCEWWTRRDLLRDKVLRVTNPVFKYVSAAGLRWLRRAPVKAIGALVKDYPHGYLGDRPWAEFVIEVMAELSPWPGGAFGESCQTAVIDQTMDLGFCLLISENTIQVEPVSARRLVRTLARHILNLAADQRRQRPDLAEFCVPELYITRLADWYEFEGRRRGLPDKNSTWASLKRRAAQWHREIWQRLMAESENSAWESLLGPLEISGIKIKPLVTGLDLYNEGREMRHCVVSYAPRCVNEGHRVFSLTGPDGRRSTLSLRPSSSGAYALDQHKGPENTPVGRAAARAALEICRLYNRKQKAATKAA